MDIIPVILANAFLFVIVISCLRRKPVKMEVIKKKITGKSRKLKATWRVDLGDLGE